MLDMRVIFMDISVGSPAADAPFSPARRGVAPF